MAKVITRYFDSADAARKAKAELINIQGVSSRIIRMFEGSDGLTDSLTALRVAPATAEAYAQKMAAGGAVLLVVAGYKPLSVAQTTRDVSAKFGGARIDGLDEEAQIPDKSTRGLNVLRDHPLMMSKRRDPHSTNYYMANWPIPLINRKKPFTAAIFEPHAHMANFPIPLISKRKPGDAFAFPRHARMANFPIRLISKRKPGDKFAFPRHARMANFPIGLTSRRTPFRGTWIGRHTRMARWPFPLLINAKQGENALIPGAPRMANFPIGLISKRKPGDKFAFPRHARMANFPIGLISKRKPSDAFAFPRHARMANMILPLVVRRTGSASRGVFGLPTLTQRD